MFVWKSVYNRVVCPILEENWTNMKKGDWKNFKTLQNYNAFSRFNEFYEKLWVAQMVKSLYCHVVDLGSILSLRIPLSRKKSPKIPPIIHNFSSDHNRAHNSETHQYSIGKLLVSYCYFFFTFRKSSLQHQCIKSA